MKIYTKTGDTGETSLFDGTRVSKTDPRVAAYGDVDELQSAIGAAVAAGLDQQLSDMCVQIQRDLFALGARLADPAHKIAERVKKAVVTDEGVTRLEGWIDSFDHEVPALRHFILSGGSPGGAALHLARAVCRRAERAVIGLGTGAAEPLILVYLNRLSDLLFVMGRAANHRHGIREVEW